MSNDPSLLKYMGTQSHETMAMEAALAQRAVHATEQAADQMLGKRSDKIDATSGDMLSRALRSATRPTGPSTRQGHSPLGRGIRPRAGETTLETYTEGGSMRAILIAAGTGAVLMGLVSMMARSGARAVRRKFRDKSAVEPAVQRINVTEPYDVRLSPTVCLHFPAAL